MRIYQRLFRIINLFVVLFRTTIVFVNDNAIHFFVESDIVASSMCHRIKENTISINCIQCDGLVPKDLVVLFCFTATLLFRKFWQEEVELIWRVRNKWHGKQQSPHTVLKPCTNIFVFRYLTIAKSGYCSTLPNHIYWE